MEDSLSSDIQLKRQAIDAMLATQMPGSGTDQRSLISQAVAESATIGKEAVHRKLLETQDTYIRELEAKCKAMSAQFLSDQDFDNNGGGVKYPLSNSKQNSSKGADRVDLVELETCQQPSGEKIDLVIHLLSSAFRVAHEGPPSTASDDNGPAEYSHPVASNLIAALQIIRNQANLDDQVSQQRSHQHASLVSAMQARFQKERDDHKALFEKSEQSFEERILALEQEIIIYKQHVRTFEQDQQTKQLKNRLNVGVLEQMDNLEEKFKQGEEELRGQNKELRRQVQEAQLNEREASHFASNIRQSLNQTETEQFACLKRIESQMKLIQKEFKGAASKLTATYGVATTTNDNSNNRIDKALSILNKQIQALDDELEQEFDQIVSLQSTQHRQELLGSPSEKQLQILLRDAERENFNLRSHMQNAELSEQEKTQNVWVGKLEISNNEKKAIQQELKNLVDISSKREEMLAQENTQLSNTILQLKMQATEREELLVSEIVGCKKQLASLMHLMRQSGNTLSQSVLLGTPEAQQVVRDISSSYSTANQSLIGGRDTELQLIRNLNENLQRQLKEANQLLGRSNSFEKQNTIGLIYNKLEVRMQDLVRQFSTALSNVEQIVSKHLNSSAPTRQDTWQREQEHCQEVFAFERQLFEEREVIQQLKGELSQAKLCLVQQIQNSAPKQDLNNQSGYADEVGGDLSLIDVLVKKFSSEIEKLKADNSQLRLQRDNVTEFYKEEFARIWQKCEEAFRNSPQQKEISSHQDRQDELRAVVNDLEDKLTELQSWIQSLRVEEIKALQEKVSLLHAKHLQTPKQTSVFRGGVAQMSHSKTKQVTPRVAAAFEANNDPANMARNESNFSFNYNAQRSLLYEELEILRDQVAQFADSYSRATQSRDVQFQILAKERNMLRQRETLLDAALQDAIDVVSICDENERRKADWSREQEVQEAQKLRETNEVLLERFENEKEVNEKELEQVQSSYQEKFVQLKERETLLELQLAHLDKDLKASQDCLWTIREQKDETVQSLNVEIANLKKFANQRQVELLEARRQVTLFYKKTKVNMAGRELELKRLYKDQVGCHVKVLEIELKKFEKIAQILLLTKK